ncbi:MAG TPA: GNAT family N-acetyltransferase [Pelomicrobium sp.]|nr:GNAT family N-acetyltransferase [Pelomicrobium sp.]
MTGYTVRLTDWATDGERLAAVRREVFVREQRVPEELEWDGADAACVHAIAEDVQGRAIGTARLLPDCSIGRMAVLAAWRGRGVGDTLLRCMLEAARRRGDAEATLHAQTHACGFYERHGFRRRGAEFMEAGIPHVGMAKSLR